MLCTNEKAIELCLQEAMAEETERRRARRKPFFRRATISVPGKPTNPSVVFCRDISPADIGLLHEIPLETGGQFTLSISLMGQSLDIQCETKWCSRIGERQYFSGSTYRCASTPQSWLMLSAILGEELHRRYHKRFPFWRAVTVNDIDGKSFAAYSRDISRAGIGLLHRDRITPSRIVLSIPASSGEQIVATADIRRCLPLGQGWYSSGGLFTTAQLDHAPTQWL